MTIPIAETPDQGQVERIRSIVEGRACVVVGSAPLKTPTAEVSDGECVIAVNGGISSVPGAADLWVLNSKLQDKRGENVKPLHRSMLQQGTGRTTGHLLLLRGPKVASEQYTLDTLVRLGVRYQDWSVLDKVTKRQFEQDVCARVRDNRPCSAGILATAIALHVGAASVRMVGFSFKPGYHYLPNAEPQAWWRDHLEADQKALAVLSARFGDRLSGAILKTVAA